MNIPCDFYDFAFLRASPTGKISGLLRRPCSAVESLVVEYLLDDDLDGLEPVCETEPLSLGELEAGSMRG